LKFEHGLIGVMAFLFGSILALIAVHPPYGPVAFHDLSEKISEYLS